MSSGNAIQQIIRIRINMSSQRMNYKAKYDNDFMHLLCKKKRTQRRKCQNINLQKTTFTTQRMLQRDKNNSTVSNESEITVRPRISQLTTQVTSLQSWVAKKSCHGQTIINECSISD